MTTLNSDIYRYLFYFLAMTDKRTFLQTCKDMNTLSAQMSTVEMAFEKKLTAIKFFTHTPYFGLNYPLHRYTIELIYDNREIPERYIIPKNKILHRFPKIFKIIAKRGNLILITKMLQLNKLDAIHNAEHAMMGAAEKGNIHILKWMQKNGYEDNEHVVGCAAKRGQLETLKWMHCSGFKNFNMAISYAAGHGDLDALKFLLDNKFKNDSNYHAAYKNQFEIVKFLHFLNPESINGVCEGAARGGNVDILIFAYEQGQRLQSLHYMHPRALQWLVDNNHIDPENVMYDGLALCNNLECVKILHLHGFPVLNKTFLIRAVWNQNVEIIEWLHDHGCPLDELVVRMAVRTKLEILKMVVAWGGEIIDDDCNVATECGNLEILEYLCDNGCKLPNNVMTLAISEGHLHIVAWCRKKGVDWGAEHCTDAIVWNQFEIFKWLRGIDRDLCGVKSEEQEVCPWNESVCWQAILSGRWDVMKLTLDHGCEFGDVSRTMVRSAAPDFINFMQTDYPHLLI